MPAADVARQALADVQTLTHYVESVAPEDDEEDGAPREAVALYTAEGEAVDGRDVPHPPARVSTSRRCRGVTQAGTRCQIEMLDAHAPFCGQHKGRVRFLPD